MPELTEEEKSILAKIQAAALEAEQDSSTDELLSMPLEKVEYPLGLPLEQYNLSSSK